MLPFLYKKVNRLKNDISCSSGICIPSCKWYFVSHVKVISFTMSGISPESPFSRVLCRDGYVISLSILYLKSRPLPFILYMEIQAYQPA